jgi:hypothetical protein
MTSPDKEATFSIGIARRASLTAGKPHSFSLAKSKLSGYSFIKRFLDELRNVSGQGHLKGKIPALKKRVRVFGY